jgi:hypothetical protein
MILNYIGLNTESYPISHNGWAGYDSNFFFHRLYQEQYVVIKQLQMIIHVPKIIY